MKYSTEYEAKITKMLEESISKILKLQKNKMHKSHLDFMCMIIVALERSSSVQYSKIAEKLSGESLEASKMRRLQRFISDVVFDYESIAYFLLSLFPKTGKITFCMDRTEWEFGQTTHNILTLVAYTHGVGIPIWFENVNENGGCCDVDDKMYMILACLGLVDKSRIKCLIADSEFIGDKWIDFLVKENIIFYLDVKSNQYFTFQGKKHQISQYMEGKSKSVLRDVQIFKKTLHLAVKRQKPCAEKKRKAFLAVVTNDKSSDNILQIYRNRWSIETTFQAFKKRGFNLEDTHLTDPVRFRKLFALVAMAFTLAFVVGLARNQQKPIKIKNHGYKANSFFRVGKDFLKQIMNPQSKQQHFKNDFEHLFLYLKNAFKRIDDIILKIVM